MDLRIRDGNLYLILADHKGECHEYLIENLAAIGNWAHVWLSHATDPTRRYLVRRHHGHWTCTCPAWKYSSSPDPCKHMEAAEQLRQLWLLIAGQITKRQPERAS